MGLGIGRGIEIAFDLRSVKAHDDKVIRRQLFVFHTGGLDDHKAALAVNAGDVAPGIGDKAALGQLHVGFVDGQFQLLEHGMCSCLSFQKDRRQANENSPACR